jgi:hypothetical protein
MALTSIIHGGRTAITDSLMRFTNEHRAGHPQALAQEAEASLSNLAPGGVYQATAVTCSAGGLLHRSGKPLTCDKTKP